MKQIFNRLSTSISYTFAVAVFAVLGGQASAALGFLFILLITDLPPERFRLHLAAITGGVLVATLVHYVLFGLLRPWGRRWELAELRSLNDWVHVDKIDPAIPTDELSEITATLENLRLINYRLAGLLSSTVVMVAVALELPRGGAASAAHFLLGGALAVALYVIFVMIVTETAIRPVLSQARHMLASRGDWHGPGHQTALRTKLSLLVGLTAISLLMLSSLFMFRPGAAHSPVTILLFCGLIMGLVTFMSALILRSILHSLQEIEESADRLITEQSAELFSGSTDREFISFAQHFYGAARRIIEYQEQLHDLNLTLEQRVTERTAELETQTQALARSQERLEMALRETAGLFEAVRDILGATQFEAVCSSLLDHLQRLVQAHAAVLYLVDHDREQVTFSMVDSHRDVRSPDRYVAYEDLKQGISGQVFESGRPVLSLSADDGIEPEETRELRRQNGVGSLIVVPLISKRDASSPAPTPNVIGTVTITNRAGERVFTEHDVDLLMALATQAATAIDNVRLTGMERQVRDAELDTARRLQTSLLPPGAPDMPGLEMAGLSQPARLVGGDFYDYFAFDADYLGIATGDVAGKGMQAALLMALVAGLLTTRVQRHTRPDALLMTLNAELHPHTLRSRLNTAFSYLTLERHAATWKLCVANAGMVAPLVRRAAGSVEWLEVGGLPLGLAEAASYTELRQTLRTGDALVLSSDGIVEAMNAAGELYGFERLAARLAEAPSGADAAELQEWIMSGVRAFVGAAEASDDLTLVVIVMLPL
ncbi:MAG: SpoIIE family protein phosphatase [Thermoflexales bacterium]|nr:SpoIIE family protein phosphatase [Thermoflexales bacterium]